MKKFFLSFFMAVMSNLSAAGTIAIDQPISLNTGTGKIYGSLLLPASAAKLPVVLIIAGSGPTDRDGNSALIKGNTTALRPSPPRWQPLDLPRFVTINAAWQRARRERCRRG